MNVLPFKSLKQLGYSPIITKNEKVVLDSLSNTLEILGKKNSDSFLNYACSFHGVTEAQFLLNYKLIRTSLYDVYKSGANIVLRCFRSELLKNVFEMPNINNMPTEQIIKELYNKTLRGFINQSHAHDHIALLYEYESIKKQIILDFLSSPLNIGSPKGIITTKPTDIESITHNILYPDLLEVDKSKAMDKMIEWIYKTHSQNESKTNPTIIIGEFAHWFLKNNLAEEFLSLETIIGGHINENMLVICPYYISDIMDENLLKKIIKPHDYIMIDHLSQIYEFTN